MTRTWGYFWLFFFFFSTADSNPTGQIKKTALHSHESSSSTLKSLFFWGLFLFESRDMQICCMGSLESRGQIASSCRPPAALMSPFPVSQLSRQDSRDPLLCRVLRESRTAGTRRRLAGLSWPYFLMREGENERERLGIGAPPPPARGGGGQFLRLKCFGKTLVWSLERKRSGARGHKRAYRAHSRSLPAVI